MSAVSIAQDTVAAADLRLEPDGDTLPAIDLGDGTVTAVVIGNAFVTYTAATAPLHRDDILFSLAFAQLHALKQGFAPAREPVGYYQYVCDFLLNIGYVGQVPSFAPLNPSQPTIELGEVSTDVLGRVIPPADVPLATATLAALRQAATSGDDSWWAFAQNAAAEQAAAFTAGLAADGADGSPTLSMGIVAASADSVAGPFLWTPRPTSSVQLNTATTALTLNESVYATVRDTIRKQVEPHLRGYSYALPLD